MADTTQQIVTSEWQQISDSDCTIQSSIINVSYDISVGADSPTDNYITLKMAEPVTFAYKAPVWVRLSTARDGNAGVNIIVIK